MPKWSDKHHELGTTTSCTIYELCIKRQTTAKRKLATIEISF
jgi:hypothetical protein